MKNHNSINSAIACVGTRLIFGLVVGLTCFAAIADVSDPACEKALAPRNTEITSDLRKHQAYVYENAERDYEELRKLNNDNSSFGGSYVGFEVDYEKSTSGAQFSQNVRDRLKKEGYINDSSDARSYYRRDLTPEQLTAWTTCITSTSSSPLPAILLSPGRISNGGFVVTMKYHYGNSPTGKWPTYSSRDGNISNVERGLNYGDSATSFDVTPKSPKQNSVSIKANLNGVVDNIVVELPKTRLINSGMCDVRLDGAYLTGKYLQSIIVGDAEQNNKAQLCQNECTQKDGCKGWFISSANKICFLFDRISGSQAGTTNIAGLRLPCGLVSP